MLIGLSFRFHESQSKKGKAYLAYVSEGMLKSQNWDMAMKFQKKNGSLFNSPSATASALMHVQNPGCLDYLHSVTEKFGPAGLHFFMYSWTNNYCSYFNKLHYLFLFLYIDFSVPAVYPLDIYARLCLVDNLERLGICRYFTNEIQSVMEDTYR